MTIASKTSLNLRAEVKPNVAEIRSNLVRLTNSAGRVVVGFVDFTGPMPSTRPVMIIPPGYGQTKTDLIPISYPLAKMGFTVLRYDHTDHVGESEGDILKSSLKSMKEDLEGALLFARKELDAPKIGVAAYSLEFRNALRVAAENKEIDFLCSILGIADIRGSLKAIYAQDIVSLFRLGVKWGVTDLLGFKVDADNFLSSALELSLHGFEGAIEDAKKLTIPVLFIVGEKDVLTQRDVIENLFHNISTSKKEIRVLPNTMHIFSENADSLRLINEVLTGGALKYLINGNAASMSEVDLCEKEVAKQWAWERQRICTLRSVNVREEIGFWAEYLKDFKRIVNLPDYWNLQEMIHDLLGEISAGERILDAGCGTGNFGSFLIVKYLYRVMTSAIHKKAVPLFNYVGVDFVQACLKEARSTHENMQKTLSDHVGLLRNDPLIACTFFCLDLAAPLCFQDSSFDKICCNLVLSYLPNDVFALNELWRVLRPGGRIVITTLKPHADLSEVYRNFLNMADTEKEVEDARCLLTNAGMIRAREAEGLYHFFSEKDLEVKLLDLGAVKVRISAAFSNQVYVGVAEKA